MQNLDKTIRAAMDQLPYTKVQELVELTKAYREDGLYITAAAAYALGNIDGKREERARREVVQHG